MNFKALLNKEKIFEILSDLAKSEGVDIYIVGGYVRDIILERERKDLDILVTGSGVKFAEKLADRLDKTKVNIYRNFGTAQLLYGDLEIELVGARKESYNRNSRKPIVEEGTFDDDIGRRDFTINTLAVSLNKDTFGEMTDTFGGLEDINKKIIRTPLDPMVTFDDDPLRIMRAFRFSAQLDFEIAEETQKAATAMAERLTIVSRERITDEFLKILASPVPSKGFIPMQELGVMKHVFREFSEMVGVEQRKEYHHKDVFYHTCEVVDNVARVSDDLWLRYAALVHDIGKPRTKKFIEGTGWTFHGHEEIGARMMKAVFSRQKLPFNKLPYVENLIRLHLRPIALVSDIVTDSAIRRMAVAAGEDLDDLITLCRADITSKNPYKVARYLENYELVMNKVKEVKEKDKLREFQSPVRGDEIMEICGIPPSKKVGEIKSAIEEAILDGIIANDYEEAKHYLMQIKDRYIN